MRHIARVLLASSIRFQPLYRPRRCGRRFSIRRAVPAAECVFSDNYRVRAGQTYIYVGPLARRQGSALARRACTLTHSLTSTYTHSDKTSERFLEDELLLRASPQIKGKIKAPPPTRTHPHLAPTASPFTKPTP